LKKSDVTGSELYFTLTFFFFCASQYKM